MNVFDTFINISNNKVSNKTIINDIAKSFNSKVQVLKIKNFADSEINLNLKNFPSFKNKTILINGQFEFNKQNSINEQLMNLFFVLDTIKKTMPKKMILLIPYLPYSRQEVGINNHLGPLEVVLNNIQNTGISKIICCDLHEPSIIKNFKNLFIEIRFDIIWQNLIKSLKIKNIALASPDKGGSSRVKRIAEALNIDYVLITKKRIKDDLAVPIKLDGDVKNKTIILIDDIIDTSRTAINACNLLLKNGAKEVFGCFAHGILSKNSSTLINKSKFKKIFVTNSVTSVSKLKNKKIDIISVNDYLTKQINTKKYD